MEIKIPDRPEIEQKEPPPDRRRFAVVPLSALRDSRLTPQAKVVLALVCSYCNKAGITHVSQAKVAEDLGIDQSRVSRAFANLKRKGYIEAIGKAMPGIRGKTLRVIYDPEITAQDAIAIAGTGQTEDLRPEPIKEQQHAELLAMADKEWTAEELQANKERLAKMLLQAFKTSSDQPKLYNPVPGDTLAVKKAKQEIRSRMRTLRKEEFEQSAYNAKQEQDSKLVTSAYKHNTTCLYADKTSMTNEQEQVCQNDIQTRLTYQEIVDVMSADLFEGVKTENDLQGCAWLADIKVTRSTLQHYIKTYPSDTAYQLAKRIIADA